MRDGIRVRRFGFFPPLSELGPERVELNRRVLKALNPRIYAAIAIKPTGVYVIEAANTHLGW